MGGAKFVAVLVAVFVATFLPLILSFLPLILSRKQSGAAQDRAHRRRLQCGLLARWPAGRLRRRRSRAASVGCGQGRGNTALRGTSQPHHPGRLHAGRATNPVGEQSISNVGPLRSRVGHEKRPRGAPCRGRGAGTCRMPGLLVRRPASLPRPLGRRAASLAARAMRPKT